MRIELKIYKIYKIAILYSRLFKIENKDRKKYV